MTTIAAFVRMSLLQGKKHQQTLRPGTGHVLREAASNQGHSGVLQLLQPAALICCLCCRAVLTESKWVNQPFGGFIHEPLLRACLLSPLFCVELISGCNRQLRRRLGGSRCIAGVTP